MSLKNSGMYKQKIYDPFIYTIPEETAPFVLLSQDMPVFIKFIMENFISFYAYDPLDGLADGYAIRFENFLDWDKLSCFDTMYLPMDVWKHTLQKTDYLKILFELGYAVVICYNKKYIPDMNIAEDCEHKMLVYDYADERQAFLCADYVGTDWTKYIVNDRCLGLAMEEYPWERNLKTGVFALRLRTNETRISMIPLVEGLRKMSTYGIHSITDKAEAYGIEALCVFLQGINEFKTLEAKAQRFFLLYNHIRESCKLMNVRMDYLRSSPNCIVTHTTEIQWNKLKNAVDKSFFAIMKANTRGIIQHELIKKCFLDAEKLINQYAIFSRSLLQDLNPQHCSD